MIDPESLDPLEVLAHLKQLGYQNITHSQLNEFVHDLKKLIRYEQKCKSVGSASDDEEACESSVGTCPHDKSENESNFRDSNDVDSELCTNCNASQTDSVYDVMSNVPSTEDSDDKKRKNHFGQQTIRPQSSFIRPWRLQPSYRGPTIGNSLKSDPVQLYHKYKLLWAQQKVPGEKSHAQLRWTIREKMLGQDPHPRPISEASTEGRSRSTYYK